MESAIPPVFISYAKPDIELAREVYRWLTGKGFACWMDEEWLRAGQDWKLEIDTAIRNSQIFVVCLSTRSVNRRGFFQTELRTAYEVWKTIPPQQAFLVPIRLDDCEIPREIQSVHCLDFFAPDGPVKLLRDISNHLGPELPGFRLREALEHIRTRRLDEALEILRELELILDDREPDLLLRVLFDIACAYSLKAERAGQESQTRATALAAAAEHLKKWHEYGVGGAWARTGRTAENEIYRMGSDSDLLCILTERRSEIATFLGPLAASLPTELPKRSGGGGGCVLLSQRVETSARLIRFEDLRVGSAILSCGPDEGRTCFLTRILRTYSSRETECVLVNGRVLLTCSQPVLDVAGEMQRADSLCVGTRLRAAKSGTVVVGSLDRVLGHFEVGTLTTDHTSHNFICGDLICANKKLLIE